MTSGQGILRLVLIATGSCLISSCTWLGGLFVSEEEETASTSTFLSQGADASILPNNLMEQYAQGINSTGARIESTETAEEVHKRLEEQGLIITDDDPRKKIEALDIAFRNKTSSDWETDFTTARKEAMRQQRPLLLWFADSRRSPNSMQLGSELLNTQEFSDWAASNIIRFRIDANVSDRLHSKAQIKRKDDLKRLTSRFNVMGYPRVFILTPDGQQIDDMRGYISGAHDSMFRKIKNSSEIALKHYNETKKKLERQGFRSWKGTNGVTTFAKLSKYNIKTGELILQEIDGGFIKSHAKNLSMEDRHWIAAEKTKWEESQKKK